MLDTICHQTHSSLLALEAAVGKLDAARYDGSLDNLSADEVTAFTRNILTIAGYYEDSVSNPEYGSIFDRTDIGTPVNQLAGQIARLYGAGHTFPSTTGTSAANAAAVFAISGPGASIVVDRSCHVSVSAGLVLSRAMPVWVSPGYDADAGVVLPAVPEELAEAVDGADPAALIVTNPTYNGYSSNLAPLIEFCRNREVYTMVDEAHGGHFRFLGGLGFPVDAVSMGADLVTQSQHKVMSTLNQGSLVHVRDDDLALHYEAAQALGFQSTSFSTLILSSLEFGVAQMALRGMEIWSRAVENAVRFKSGLREIKGLRVIEPDDLDPARVAGADPTRVTINVRHLGLTGWDVETRLADLNIYAEMASLDTVLFLIGPTDADGVEAFLAGMRRVSDEAPHSPRPPRKVRVPDPDQVILPCDAFRARRRRRVPVAEAVGEIAAENIGAYPPGQTIVGPGERVSREAVEFLHETVRSGGHLKRVRDDNFQSITIVEEI